MKTTRVCGVFLLSVLVLALSGAAAAQQPPAETAPNYEALARAAIAELAARRFDQVFARFDERLANTLPADKLAASWDGIILQVGEFRGITSAEQEETAGYHVVFLTCTFERLSLLLRMAFNDKGQMAGFSAVPPEARVKWTPPDYATPDSFEEKPITVRSGRWELPGTLTLPKGTGPFPGVVLVHGSGPNDQDESVGALKMFRDLAGGLASRGIAVLRYTKRTRQYGMNSAEDPAALTVKEETIDDAQAGVALAAATPGIDARRVFIIGHSLGAFLGPRITAKDSQVAGLVLMAGNTRPIEELVVEQIRYTTGLNGTITPQGQKLIDAAERSAREFRDPDLKPGMTVHLLGASLPGSYVLDLRTYHPAETAAALTIPIFVMQGERDYQVRMADFEGWKKALAGHRNAALKSYPALNHLFVAGSGPSSPAEYAKPGHVSEEVVRDIAAWMAAQGGKPR